MSERCELPSMLSRARAGQEVPDACRACIAQVYELTPGIDKDIDEGLTTFDESLRRRPFGARIYERTELDINPLGEETGGTQVSAWFICLKSIEGRLAQRFEDRFGKLEYIIKKTYRPDNEEPTS